MLEGEVADLGGVRAAGPYAGPAEHRPPLDLTWLGTDRVSVNSYSDIWLPWCSARFEEDAHIDDLADNRALALRHTPRLNALLARIAALASGEIQVNAENTAPDFAFQRVDDPTPGKNRMHLDFSTDDVEAEVARLVAAGATETARHAFGDFGWVVLTDPAGNYFCVAQPE